MSDVVSLGRGPHPPREGADDFREAAARLREVAAAMEAGNVQSFLLCTKSGGEWFVDRQGQRYDIVGLLEDVKLDILERPRIV